jgi:chromosome segregation ATPase
LVKAICKKVKPELTIAIRRLRNWSHRHDQNQIMKRPNFLFGKPSPPAKEQGKVLRESLAFDAAGRRWPIVAAPPQNRIGELEDTVAKLSAEVNLRCTQVADLYNSQQARANEVLDACDEIDLLGKTIESLQGTIAQREMQAAAADKKVIELEKENSALRLDLDIARKEMAELSHRLLSVETAFDDRETSFNERELSIVAAQERNSQLNDELTAKWHDANELIATVEKASEARRNKFDQQSVQLDNEIKKVKTVAAEQNALVKNLELARAMLMDYCDSLAKTVSAVECMKGDLRKDFITQTKYIFELARTVNRNPATPKTTKLSAELRHEHSEHSSVEGSSADRRENTVHYLPKPSGLRARAG